MRILHLLIKTVLLVGLLVMGVLTLAHVLFWQTALTQFFFGDTLGRILIGLSAVFLVLLYWATALPDKTPRYLLLKSEGGFININLNAINEYLSKLDGEFAGIVRMRADVSVTRHGQVDVHLDINVRENTKVQQLSQVLQQRIRDTMRDDLGIAEVRQVKINVEKIVPLEKPESERADWHDASV